MRTKIIATLGPATNTESTVHALVEAGARIFRLNFSHGTQKDFANLVKIIRKLERETGLVLSIIQDLSGPKIRTCDAGQGTLNIAKGTKVLLGVPGTEKGRKEPFICLDNPLLIKDTEIGDKVALSDGMLRFTVVGRENDKLVLMEAENSGMAPPRKGITFPGKTTPLAAFTAKDRKDLSVGMKLGVDMVAMSYVQKPEDICSLKSEMLQYGRRVPVVAKLERSSAVENLEGIIIEADGIMVARGDLGLEMDLQKLPATQKRIVNACNRAGKPVIVATQMLLSMVNSPMATRAETTDVANAILDGADCVMLSEETAIGQYSAEAVQFMGEVGAEAEAYRESVAGGAEERYPVGENDPAKILAYSAALLAEKARAKAIVCHSTSGGTSRILSACRPNVPIYALSLDDVVRHFTNLSWGVIPATPGAGEKNHQARAEQFVKDQPMFAENDSVIVTAGHPKEGQRQTRTNVVKIFEK